MQIFEHFPQQPGADNLIATLDSRQVSTHKNSAVATFASSRVILKFKTSLPGIASRPTDKLGGFHGEVSDIYARTATTNNPKTALFPT